MRGCAATILICLLFFMLLTYVPVHYLGIKPNLLRKEAYLVQYENKNFMREVLDFANCATRIPADSVCHNKTIHPEVLLAVVVNSAVTNFGPRQVVRETWGSILPVGVRYVFILGLAPDEKVNELVKEESALYGDILQEGFLDTYFNLTVKVANMLRWAWTHCNNAKYLMKVDDDVHLNLPNLLTLLKNNTHEDLLVGNLICEAPVSRDYNSKWYTPKNMYGMSKYPHYLSGTGYVISHSLVHQLYINALESRFFHLEDVFITGILPSQLGVKPKHHPAFHMFRTNLHPCVTRSAITIHNVSTEERYYLWRTVGDTPICFHIRDSEPLTAPKTNC